MKKVILIGSPVTHSLSPALHNHWLGELGIDGHFETRETQMEEIPGLVDDLRAGRLAGINVTIPHKKTVFSYLDEYDETAGEIGAANTLYIRNRKLAGKNTDPEGFIENLKFHVPGWDPLGASLVLGAGAAARAAVSALLKEGQKNIQVCGRNMEKTKEMARVFSGKGLRVLDWSDRHRNSNKFDLLINATPLGLPGFNPVDFDLKTLKKSALVYDLVYGPEKTAFLKTAEKAGLKTVDGLGMLVFQAIPAFETWFGKRPQFNKSLLNLLRQKI